MKKQKIIIFLIMISLFSFSFIINSLALSVSVQTQEANVANIYYEITANDEEIPTDLTFTIVDEDTGDEVYTGKTENGIINVSNIPFGNYSIKVDNYKEIKVNVDKQYLEKQHILKQADLKEVAIGEKSFLVKIPQE